MATTSDRWTFLAEWEDSFSSINWRFNFFFYPFDETIEMFDLMKHRLFLKRTKCDVCLQDVFVGASVRICSRLIRITDYGDTFTRIKFESMYQKTCGFLKPEVGDKKGEILKIFLEKQFKIINLKTILLEEIDVCQLFKASYVDEIILNSVIEHLIGGPVVAFQLLGSNAVTRLLNTVGPEDPIHAKAEQGESLRAIYGIDKIRNAVYVSPTLESAEKDFNVLFGKKPFAFIKNTICSVIKPHAVKEGRVGDIINTIEDFGYEITGLNMCTLSVEQAETFYQVYKYVVSEYRDMVQELSSGVCVALEVRGRSEKETISNFRELVGPLDLEVAKILRPHSLRAKFGKSKIQNAVHVTDLIDDATREVEYFFRTLR